MGERFENILVIGDGGWGTALAVLLAEKGCRVHQWSAFPEYAKEVQRTRLNKKFVADEQKKLEILAAGTGNSPLGILRKLRDLDDDLR